MRFLADENAPGSLIRYLRENGHDVETVVGSQLAGRPDDEIMGACNASARVLITLDARMVAISRIKTGMILFRPGKGADASRYVTLLKKVLNSYSVDEITGSIIVTSPAGTRRRPLPAAL